MKYLIVGAALCSFALAANAQDTPVGVFERVAPTSSPASAVLTGAFDWKLRLQPGQKWEIRSFTRMTQDQDLKIEMPANSPVKPPTHLQIKSIQRMVLDYEVLSLDKFGAATIRLTYRDVSNDTQVFNDGKPMPKSVGGSPATLLKGIEGASLTMKQAPDGKIWSITGFDTLQTRIFDSMPGLSTAEKAKARAFAGQFFSDKFLKGMISSFSGAFPKYPVRVGDSWDYDASLPADLPLQLAIQGKRTLKARKDGIASVQEELTYNSGSMKLKAENVGVAFKDFEGTVTGASQIDEATGLATSSTASQKLTATIEVKPPAPQGGAPTPTKVQSLMRMTSEMRLVMERK